MEIYYLKLRKFFFWLFFSIFIFLAPFIIFYALGYKFNFKLKKFQKTGALFIKTIPKDTEIFVEGKKIDCQGGCILRGLLPDKYLVQVRKEGFYPYEANIEILSSKVKEMEVFLVPYISKWEKINLPFQVYKFFFTEHFLERNIFLFTEQGIYLTDINFKKLERICQFTQEISLIDTILGLKELKSGFIFWNKDKLWRVEKEDNKYSEPILTYSAKEIIFDVYLALKEKYLIIHDGFEIFCVENASFSFFPLKKLNSLNAKIFYDNREEILYIKDKDENGYFRVFKVNFKDLIYE